MFHTFRLLLFITIIFNSAILNALSYDDDILNIFSRILPRIVLMSSKKNDLQEEITICILRDNVDERIATSINKKINNYYKNGIKNYHIKLINTNYLDTNICESASVFFLLNSDNKNIKQAIEFSNKHKILTISYDSKLLENGVDISMFLGRKVTPYINVNSTLKKEIKLNNTLLRISKIYNNEAN